MDSKSISRRNFLKGAVLGVAGFALTPGLGATSAFGEVATPTAGNDILVIEDGGIKYELCAMDDNGVRTVTVTNTSTGAVERVVYDSGASTVFSTYTGKTVELTGELAPANEEQLPNSARSRTSYSTKNISYAQIKQAAGVINNVAQLATVILSFVSKAELVANISNLVSYVAGQVNNIIRPSSTHGIRVTIATTKYYRHGNNVPYRTVKQITKAVLY